MKTLDKKIPSLLMIIFLVGFPQISETIYTPALPNIAHSLMTSSHLVEWTLSIYFIGFAAGVTFWGRVSDHIGRRKSMLYGIIVYCIGCLLCLISPSIYWLLASRLLQAFGASVGSVVTQTIIRDIFQGTERNKVFSVIAIALSAAPAIGPILGGYLVEWVNWRANFILLLFMGIVLLIANFITLAETHPSLNKGVVVTKFSAVIKTLMRDKRVWACTFLVGAFNGIYFSYFAEGPFILINLLHFSPSQYGWFGIAIAMGSIVGGKISHKLNEHFSPEVIVFIGGIVTLLSIMGLNAAILTGYVTPLVKLSGIVGIVLPMSIFAVGMSLVLPNVLSVVLAPYREIAGTAGSIFGLSYYILIAGMTFIMGFLHNGTFFPMPLYFLTLAILIVMVCRILIKNKVECR